MEQPNSTLTSMDQVNAILEPGDILLFEGANLITQIQGDTRAMHVCMVSNDKSKLWTTGGSFICWFAKVDANKYLPGKTFAVLRSTAPLSPVQLDSLENTNRLLKGQFYGFWKYAQLEAAAFKTGFIPCLGSTPQPMALIKNPICSQAVACAFWRAGVQIGAFRGKVDATAILPETFEDEADRGVLLKIVAQVKL